MFLAQRGEFAGVFQLLLFRFQAEAFVKVDNGQCDSQFLKFDHGLFTVFSAIILFVPEWIAALSGSENGRRIPVSYDDEGLIGKPGRPGEFFRIGSILEFFGATANGKNQNRDQADRRTETFFRAHNPSSLDTGEVKAPQLLRL
jgi:hypothetical protein